MNKKELIKIKYLYKREKLQGTRVCINKFWNY